MDIKEGLERQRLVLLRLLAGLVFAIRFLSVAPIAPTWSYRARGFIGSVLGRAEAAVENLIFVQVCLIAKQRGDDGRWIRYARHPAAQVSSFDDLSVPTLPELRRRLARLFLRLERLPSYGARRLHRLKIKAVKIAATPPEAWVVWGYRYTNSVIAFIRPSQCSAPRPWHPPDLLPDH